MKNMCYGLYPVVGSTSFIGCHNEYKIEPPGVVTVRSGSLGFIQYINENYWLHNTTLWVKNFKNNLPLYVYYYLQTLDLKRFNSGAGVPTLNRNDLDALEIYVAPATCCCRSLSQARWTWRISMYRCRIMEIVLISLITFDLIFPGSFFVSFRKLLGRRALYAIFMLTRHQFHQKNNP